ncbi:MAG: S41 family peptidase [Myxococcota bacterium]
MWWLLYIFGSLAAWAADSPIARAVDHIDRLYLHRADVDEAKLLRSAATELTRRVHWLRAAFQGRQVVLQHGDGRVLGTVEARDMNDLPRALDELARIVGTVEKTEATRPEVLERSVLRGLARSLDRYSRVLTGERIDGFSVRLSGTESGIGVGLGLSDGRIQVDSVVPRGPAASAGLVVGDRLITIDGAVIDTVREANERLRGAQGTSVMLTLDGAGGGARAVSVRRARVVVPNVRHAVLAGGVGYVHIEHVSQRTVQNLVAALDDLDAKGALERGLVVDLRDNTGGSMKEAARVADLFVSDGLLLRTAGRDGGPIENLQHEMVARDRPDDLEMPVVVVVNERTASGAEILTGALIEHGRAGVVGQRTYGKGTVQKPLSLGDGLQLNLTVAHYVLLNERRIGRMGIEPDVWVGQVRSEGRGLGFYRWPAAAVPWTDVVPAMPSGGDVEVELARRAVLAASNDRNRTARSTILEALHNHAEGMRREGERRMTVAAAGVGLDWSATRPAEGSASLDLKTTVVVTPVGQDRLRVEAEVHSQAEVPLPQVAVQLRSRSRLLDGVVMAIGRVAPGARRSGATIVTMTRPGPSRLEAVEAFVRVGRRVTRAGRHLLTLPKVEGPKQPGPDVQVAAPGLAAPPQLLPLPIEVGDGDGVPIDHVVVWANGEKIAWHPGDGPDLVIRPVMQLRTGPNRLRVEAVDVEGRRTDVQLHILGLPQAGPTVSMGAAD